MTHVLKDQTESYLSYTHPKTHSNWPVVPQCSSLCITIYYSFSYTCGRALSIPVPFCTKVDLDSRHMGWVTSELPGGDHHVIKVELKGPENTLRVRQVKILGWKEGESIKILGQISASMAQQKNCEAETLRVFRLITSQVRLGSSYVSIL